VPHCSWGSYSATHGRMMEEAVLVFVFFVIIKIEVMIITLSPGCNSTVTDGLLYTTTRDYILSSFIFQGKKLGRLGPLSLSQPTPLIDIPSCLVFSFPGKNKILSLKFL
jgi:hypothetical protein